MAKYMLVYSLVILSLVVGSSAQGLNKKTVLSGLSQLDFSFLKAPQYCSSVGTDDKHLCQCINGAQPQSVYKVKYYNVRTQEMTLCICSNPVMSADYMIDHMGKVPYAVRLDDKGMISATVNTCGGAFSGGDVTTFCDNNMDVTVFIHESAHSFDRGRSASAEWQNAVNKDSCVPDPYSNTNYVEDFAQVVVLWVHLVGTGHAKDLGGAQYACMKNQLQLMAKYLPPTSLKF